MRSKVLLLAAVSALAAGTSVGANAATGSTDSDTITFGVPYVTDPIHTYGEPDIGIEPQDGKYVYVSGPAGTGTQRSIWSGSSDGGQTFRPIAPATPSAAAGTESPPGGGDTEIVFDHTGKQYFADLYTLTCFRAATTADHGATVQTNPHASDDYPGADRQWMLVYDPPPGTASESPYTGAKPLIYMVYNHYVTASGPGSGAWIKSNDGINWTTAAATTASVTGVGNQDKVQPTAHFGADGYPSIDQVSGKVFEASYSGSNTVKLNIGTPDADGKLTFLDDLPGGSSNLITVATDVKVGSDTANFVVSSMDNARNLYVTWVDRSSVPGDRQTWVAAASAASGWTNWTKVQVSDGSAVTGDHVNVFPWIKAGGPGRADVVWYGDSTDQSPSSTKNPHSWNVFMNQAVFPVDANGGVTGAAPSLQLVKVTPHPMDLVDICLSGTGCITSQGNRNLADFFMITTDPQGRAQIVFNDLSNGLIQAGSNNAADHAGAPLVMIAHQNGGPGLFGDAVSGPTAAPVTGQGDDSGDALYPVIGGANNPAMDLVDSRLSMDGSSLTVTMKVADLTQLPAAHAATRGVLAEYVTRWQMGNTLYYAEMSTSGNAADAQFAAGRVQSVDLCSVSACDPHVLVYPEGPSTTSSRESGTATCPSSPSATNPCTITITIPAADVGAPTSSSLFESVGTYAISAAHPQFGTNNPEGQADSVPLEIDGICCFNFSADAPSPNVPEVPLPALAALTALLVTFAVTSIRRRRRSAA
jgi:hypothetical protein